MKELSHLNWCKVEVTLLLTSGAYIVRSEFYSFQRCEGHKPGEIYGETGMVVYIMVRSRHFCVVEVWLGNAFLAIGKSAIHIKSLGRRI